MKSILNNISLAILLTFSFTASANTNKVEAISFFSHANTFLTKNVSKGKVNYKAISNNTKELDAILAKASTLSLVGKDENTVKAFWINAYNLTVIKSIINKYPVKSPMDIPGFFDKTTHKLANKTITLNDIENKILRPTYKDPRFHFVLVCGAVSCPPLISKAYMPATLEVQMEKQAKLALNGTYFIKVNTKKKRIEGSQILKWYKSDFTMNGGTEIDYFNKYRTVKIPKGYKIIYTEYNWSLNNQL